MVSRGTACCSYRTVTPNVTQPTAKKVTGVKLKAKTNTTLTFSWASQAYAEYYNIYKYDSKKGKYVKVGTTAGNVNTFKVRGFQKVLISDLRLLP